MHAEDKMRLAAMQDEHLQDIFGDSSNGTFRWFATQLVPNYLKVGQTCARVRLISTVRLNSHETKAQRAQNRMAMPRFQIDVLDFSYERARSAAKAIVDWLALVDFSSDAQFGSPVTSPNRHPNQVLNERDGMEPSTTPAAFVRTLDIRILNLEEN